MCSSSNLKGHVAAIKSTIRAKLFDVGWAAIEELVTHLLSCCANSVGSSGLARSLKPARLKPREKGEREREREDGRTTEKDRRRETTHARAGVVMISVTYPPPLNPKLFFNIQGAILTNTFPSQADSLAGP